MSVSVLLGGARFASCPELRLWHSELKFTPVVRHNGKSVILRVDQSVCNWFMGHTVEYSSMEMAQCLWLGFLAGCPHCYRAPCNTQDCNNHFAEQWLPSSTSPRAYRVELIDVEQGVRSPHTLLKMKSLYL